jgi:uncharacterized membrane protein
LKEDGARDTGSKGEIRIVRLVAVCGILVVTGLLGGFAQMVMPPTSPAAKAQAAAVSAERGARRRRETMSG